MRAPPVLLILALALLPAADADVDAVIRADVLRDVAWSDPAGTDHRGVWGDAKVLMVEGYNADGHADLLGCHEDSRLVVADVAVEARSNDPVLTASGHGAWVAGSLCGSGEGLPGHHGVAPGAMAMSWNDWFSSDPGPQRAYHEQHGFRLMTHSTLTPPWQVWAPVADGADMTVFWAAGNAGGDGSSSQTVDNDDARILVIAAATWDGATVASYSSRGDRDDPSTWPDLTAPGCRFVPHPLTDQWVRQSHEGPITPAVPDPGDCPDADPAATEADYVRVWGTSFAAPTVAAVAALMLEVHPALASDDLRHILRATARPFLPTADGDGDGNVSVAEFRAQHGWQAGWGMVDASRAVAAAHAMSFGSTLADATSCADVADGTITHRCPAVALPVPSPPPPRNATEAPSAPAPDEEPTSKGSPLAPWLVLTGLIVAAARRRRAS